LVDSFHILIHTYNELAHPKQTKKNALSRFIHERQFLVIFTTSKSFTWACSILQKEFELQQHEMRLQGLQGACSDQKSQMKACSFVEKQDASRQRVILHCALYTQHLV